MRQRAGGKSVLVYLGDHDGVTRRPQVLLIILVNAQSLPGCCNTSRPCEQEPYKRNDESETESDPPQA
jgi:hypothetical protein